MKSIVNGSGMPFTSFNAALNTNKIMIGNSAALADSSIHKQLNYQILKTISNKNNTGVTNLLSPNKNSNNIGNGGIIYSGIQGGFKGIYNITFQLFFVVEN